MANITQHDVSSEETEEKQTVFNIFHMEKKEDAGIITKPLENIMTCEYNVQFKIAYSLMNEPNTHKEHPNEDDIFVRQYDRNGDNVFVAAVLDGHQGINALNYVQSTLFDALANMLFENPENIPDHVCEIFQQIDTTYCEEKAELLRQITAPSRRACFCGSRRSDLHHENLFLGCGCVLSLLCIHNNQLLLAGLGDCGIVFSIGGRARYALQRHNPTDALEKQRILMAGGSVLNNRVDNMLEVSRSIGDVWFKKSYQTRSFGAQRNDPRQDVVIAEPDVKIYPLSSDVEFCIIGSDGLFASLSFQTAINVVKDFIARGRSGEDACRELITRARAKSTDDISVIVLFFHVPRHNRTTDAYVGALDEQQFAQSDDEPVESGAASPPQRLARSHSEVSMSLYLSRQSQRDSATRASVREMFARTAEEFVEMRLPSVGRDGASMLEGKPLAK